MLRCRRDSRLTTSIGVWSRWLKVFGEEKFLVQVKAKLKNNNTVSNAESIKCFTEAIFQGAKTVRTNYSYEPCKSKKAMTALPKGINTQ